MGRRRLASGASAPVGGAFSMRDAPPIVVVAKSAQLRFPRRHKLRIPRSGHANQNSLTSLLRLSPPRRRGGDPNAKTAPAPLHPKGTSAPTPWAWALLLSPPRRARRGPHLETSRRKCAAPDGKEKCSAGRSAQAQTSCRRRGKVGGPARQSGTETRCPWGNLWPGEVWDTFCADFRCR